MSERKPRPLKGARSPAPCWWCSRQLHGWKGWSMLVDGHEVMMHGECAKWAMEDEDMQGRIEEVKPWKEARQK